MSKWTTHAVLKSNLQLAKLIVLSTPITTHDVHTERDNIITEMHKALEKAREDLADGGC